MKNKLKLVLAALLVAAIWGYFADIRHGEIGWFIGRLIFLPSFVLALSFLREKPTRTNEK
jgi:hypothetical protein